MDDSSRFLSGAVLIIDYGIVLRSNFIKIYIHNIY